MRKALAVIFTLLIIFAGAAQAAGDEMLENPGFEGAGTGGIPSGWYRDMWLTDTGVSQLVSDNAGYDGQCVMVRNADANDARFAQDVDVAPDTLYEITCMVRAEGIPEDTIGANISIKDTFCYSEYVYDTAGEWVSLALYGRTGEDQDSLTVFARVGGYGGLNSGVAWFDSFSMREVDAVPEGYIEQDFGAITSSSGSGTSDSADDGETEPARNTEAWLLFSLGIVLVAAALMRKPRRSLAGSDRRYNTMFLIALAAALVVRIVVAWLVRGYYTDVNCFMGWSERIYADGFAKFYNSESFCDYPPLYMAMLYLVGAVRSLTGIAMNSNMHVVLIKLMPIAFDLGLAGAVYLFSKERAGARAAMLLGLVCALNPAAIVDSAAWGQIDGVFTLFTVLGAMTLMDGAYCWALTLFTLGMLIKPQTLLFAPLGLFAMVFDIVVHPDRRRFIKRALAGIGVSLALIVVFALVFHDRAVSPMKWLVNLYSGTMNSYSRMTINAFNLYELMGLNWAETDAHGALTICAWVMFGLAYAYSFIIYARARKPSAIFMSAAVLIMCICAFGPMIHERYVYPALVLLLLAYACERDRRLLVSLTALTVTLFLNQMLVLQGGMTAANYGHLQDSENWINQIMSLVVIANALFTAYTAFSIYFMGRVEQLSAPKKPEAPSAGRTLFSGSEWRLRLRRADYIIMAVVTCAYAVLAFVNLGTLSAPETSWISSQSGENVTFDLGQVRTYRMEYYGGICNTNFTVELSNDGENWTEPYYAEYDQGEIFRWLFFRPMNEDGNAIYETTQPTTDGSAYVTFVGEDNYPYQTSRYVRITAASAGLTLTEIGFLDEAGQPYEVSLAGQTGYMDEFKTDASRLIDEQDTVPEKPSYLNSTYFDEIYHARTAYEFAHGMSVYEWTHPPLGKVLMMVGIEIFGMCPFGWRFMGALMGVLMLPLMYLMVKQLGGSTKVSAVAMLLLALDSMHFTQTRIATIDSYAVFFIMLMYLFMFRYVRMSFNRQPLAKTLIPLMLCGITMGCAWATKWIGIYASAGLAILFFWTLVRRFREHLFAMKRADDEFQSDEERERLRAAREDFWKNTLITLGVCVVFFVAIPVLIYYFSYYWHMQYSGGLSIKGVLDTQERMFKYHAGLSGDDHYFRSPWYEWPVIAWPMWYYDGSKYIASSLVSSISCMGNPAVWWTGLAAILGVMGMCAWKRRADDNSCVISVSFLSQYLPWVLVPRSTFIYHYFASVPFIIMATVDLLGRLEREHKKAFNITCGVLILLALVLFIMFYPFESGTPMARDYAKYLRWFKWYNYAK